MAEDLKAGIERLLADYELSGVPSVTCDTLAKALHAAPSKVMKALQQLIIAGRIEYARKNPRSAQPRFTLSGGR